MKNQSLIALGAALVDQVVQGSDAVLAAMPVVKGGAGIVTPNAWNKLAPILADFPTTTGAGGAAANTAKAYSICGNSCGYWGILGNDLLGADFRRIMSAQGVDVSMTETVSGMTGRCLSYVTPDAERTMFAMFGCAYDMIPENLPLDKLAEFSHCFIEGFFLYHPDLLRRLMTRVKQAGLKVAFGLASKELAAANADFLREFCGNAVDVVFCNAEEAHAFCGESRPDVSARIISRLAPPGRCHRRLKRRLRG